MSIADAKAISRRLLDLPSPAQTPPEALDVNTAIATRWTDVAGGERISYTSPAQWPEDVVERAVEAFKTAEIQQEQEAAWEGDFTPDIRSSMRAALATLPPPEDERVKGLVETLELIGSMEAFQVGGVLDKHRDAELLVRIHFARSVLASYRGGA